MVEKRYSFKARFFYSYMGKIIDKIKKYSFNGIITVAAGVAAVGVYSRIWEYRQPIQTIENAQVLDIRQDHYSNDLHLTSNGYKIKIDKLEGLIDFKEKNWGNTIRKGDSIDLEVRKSFSLFKDRLKGIKIKTHDSLSN
jgi:hypothetical protein